MFDLLSNQVLSSLGYSDGVELFVRHASPLHECDRHGGWQRIWTAPKDGRGVLMIDMTAPAPEPGMGYWAGDLWSCVDPSPDEGASIETIQAIFWCSPTHWMPIPAPPAPAKGENQ